MVSLFPSLKNIETARLTRHAILESEIEFENINYHKALRYISIVGGKDLLKKSGLGHLAPTWLGDREDLMAVGGKKAGDGSNWRDTILDMFDIEKKRIMATWRGSSCCQIKGLSGNCTIVMWMTIGYSFTHWLKGGSGLMSGSNLALFKKSWTLNQTNLTNLELQEKWSKLCLH